MPIVRSASISGLDALVRELGGDPIDLAARVGLPAEALTSSEVMVPLDVASAALELASEELRCPDLGLRLGQTQDLDGLGPLSVALRHSPTMGDALECAQRFLTLHHQASTLSIHPDPYGDRGVTGLRFAWHYDGSAYRQAMDKHLLNVHHALLFLVGDDYGLRSVELSYTPAAPVTRYQEAFGGVRVNVARPLTMLRLPVSLLKRPIEGAQETLRAMALHYLQDQDVHDDLDTTARVRTALHALLGSGRTNTDWVATHLETSPRTLQRRLTEEGTTFRSVLDDVRREKAETWLAETELSLADVAAMLDLADQATLSRSARRWWGTTPTARRRELRSAR